MARGGRHQRNISTNRQRNYILMATTTRTTGTTAVSGPRPVRAPRGTEISCKGWQQEAVLRMLMNNLDPEVAEHPEDLVVYGGTGRAALTREGLRGIGAT